ncbi:uncharacterized protein LOC107847471 [Capsicum annuum]|uniref:uncharacterized protein LOC107847471 n=1 Tax=Capsicum annuum TaxID=4072 RepID=UPI001FB075E7|nr:uncharacterized protein LOC107847471 [Capsicum annuum]XP_047255129.1 uncharacterized protein LOC107847471 [Capsicum annuum]
MKTYSMKPSSTQSCQTRFRSTRSQASLIEQTFSSKTNNWCEQIKFHFGVLDLDVALYSEKPTTINEASSDEEKSYYKNWDRSNILGLMFMRMNIAGNIKTTLPKTESAKELLKLVEESSQTADKSLVVTLIGNLTTMKFDGSRTMHEYVIEIINIAARLKSLGIEVEQNFLVQFIINSLSSKYGPFQMNYNTIKDKWNVRELHGMLVQEETRLKNQGTHSINCVNHQGVEKKKRNMVRDNRSNLMLISPHLKYIRKETRMESVISMKNLDTFRKIT